MAGHNYYALEAGRAYQRRGQWLGSATPSISAPDSGFWGLEVWSGGGAGGMFSGSRLAAVHRYAGSADTDVYGVWDAAAGGYLYAYRSLAFPPTGWP